MNTVLIILGKLISSLSKYLNLGHGSTWPGHIALEINKNFIQDIHKKNPNLKIILIAGTNGKTTTAKLIQSILEKKGFRTFRNISGANLLNGIASSLVLYTTILSAINYEFAIFEVDENSLPLVLQELTPKFLVLLNLFRDQLDRYGEVNTIANKWNLAMKQLNNETMVILNADDPQIAYLGKPLKKVFYFGLNDKKLTLNQEDHASDSTFCPECGTKLSYNFRFYSHLGDWYCTKCKLKRPKLDNDTSPFYPLDGIYNRYNTNAVVLLSKIAGIDLKIIEPSLHEFTPAFGRQEVLNVQGKRVQLFLSKNPTSFNQSLRTVSELGAKNLLIVLNDRIPDGRDVSWIWDVDFEEYLNEKMNVHVSGDRVYDMALRLRYIQKSLNTKYQPAGRQGLILNTEAELSKAVQLALKQTPQKNTLYILPTYSAMLEVRKILTGKKIL